LIGHIFDYGFPRVTFMAKALDIVVGVGSSHGERNDVINFGGRSDESLAVAFGADWVNPETPSALMHGGATFEPLVR
jgi:hypothetical protein